ncbi:phage portal protein [Microbacterium sp. NPDC091662]|uniref:phage portal protein n=1 Tax=Microbacterium sp. NPDC091662 TaxID=3364211 RepID=UPI00380BCCAF
MARFWDWLLGDPNASTATVPFPIFPIEEESTIQRLVAQDLFKGEGDILSRASALQVGGVKKGRALICGAVADAPLAVYRLSERVAKQPTWTYRTDAGISPWHTWSMVLDDFIFYDRSLLAFDMGADGYPVDIMRVRYDRWDQDSEGNVRIDGQVVDQKLVMVVPGPGGGGLLSTGAADVKAARALARARAARAIAPVPLVELHQISDEELTQDEVDGLVDAWSAARAANGGVGFTDSRVEVRVHGDKLTDFYEGAINASRTDIANHLNIPAALLDGTPNTASLTYETREGQSQVLWDTTVPYWVGPLEAALSSDRVVPRGQKVRFDFTSKRGPTPTPAIAGPDIED